MHAQTSRRSAMGRTFNVECGLAGGEVMAYQTSRVTLGRAARIREGVREMIKRYPPKHKK
ncbi:MAG: hypothetical protein ACRD09_08970 [Vicinamibacterales bacterium]